MRSVVCIAATVMLMAGVLLGDEPATSVRQEFDLLSHSEDWAARQSSEQVTPKFIFSGKADRPGTWVYQHKLNLHSARLSVDLQFVECETEAGGFTLLMHGLAPTNKTDADSLDVCIQPRRGKIVCGKVERSYRPLPEAPLHVELMLTIEADQLQVNYGREVILEAPIRFVDGNDQSLSIMVREASVRVQRFNASAVSEHADAAVFQPVELKPQLVKLSSPLLSYFGTHYSRGDGFGERYSAVRSFGGTHVRWAPPTLEQEPVVPEYVGPFTKKPVRVRLEEFHSQSRHARDPMTGPALFDAITRRGITTVYVTPTGVVYEDKPYDRDSAYWFYRLAHEKYPTLNRYAVWQIGNELLSLHWDPKRLGRDNTKRWWNHDHTLWYGYDLKWKLDFYINHWLGPAVQAIEAASRDVYGDERAIPIAAGSLNPYNPPNVWYIEQMMQATFDGQHVPSLAGQPVYKHIDYLTVHYMLAPPEHDNTRRLDQFVADYLQTGKVKGIWITEDHGGKAAGAPTVLERGMYFLRWVARHGLTAEQAKVFWYGEHARKGLADGTNLMSHLGGFFGDRELHFAAVDTPNAYCHVVTARAGSDAQTDRAMVVILPRRGIELNAGAIRIDAPQLAGAWKAQAIDYSYTIDPTVFDVQVEPGPQGVRIQCNRKLINPTAIYLSR
ncbi:hypothetical protein HED60_14895 [Planctomycetales bacterium ZRK34]|nr:hypothetical protein HED60_14895 [Planctomycetales bacterium ZRK34]